MKKDGYYSRRCRDRQHPTIKEAMDIAMAQGLWQADLRRGRWRFIMLVVGDQKWK